MILRHNFIKHSSQAASVRVRDRGLRCALHYCASSGAGASQAARAACADRVLMAAPALADARDADGLTPLHLAVVHGNVPLVQTLLAAGADVNARDDEHHTVVHWATGELRFCLFRMNYECNLFNLLFP